MFQFPSILFGTLLKIWAGDAAGKIGKCQSLDNNLFQIKVWETTHREDWRRVWRADRRNRMAGTKKKNPDSRFDWSSKMEHKSRFTFSHWEMKQGQKKILFLFLLFFRYRMSNPKSNLFGIPYRALLLLFQPPPPPSFFPDLKFKSRSFYGFVLAKRNKKRRRQNKEQNWSWTGKDENLRILLAMFMCWKMHQGLIFASNRWLRELKSIRKISFYSWNTLIFSHRAPKRLLEQRQSLLEQRVKLTLSLAHPGNNGIHDTAARREEGSTLKSEPWKRWIWRHNIWISLPFSISG